MRATSEEHCALSMERMGTDRIPLLLMLLLDTHQSCHLVLADWL